MPIPEPDILISNVITGQNRQSQGSDVNVTEMRAQTLRDDTSRMAPSVHTNIAGVPAPLKDVSM